MKTTNTNKNSKLNRFINNNIKENRYFLFTGIWFMIYSLIEISDCIYLCLIIINVAPNVYLNMGIIIPEIQQIMTDQPIYFLPFFLSFTLMRIISTIGIFKNYRWGFYIGCVSLILTMIMTLLFIPFGFIELFFCSIILVSLIIGFFGTKPII
ncbi:MAG: hypothetical protein ACFFA7_13455 [Promethearchaeota archaeon]